MPAAIGFQQRHDRSRQRARCHALAGEALSEVGRRHGLSPIGRDEDWVQMVALPVPHREAAALRAALFARGIEIPVTQRAGQRFVRLSVQAYDSANDIDRLLDALSALTP